MAIKVNTNNKKEKNAMKELEKAIELHINQQLYDKGHITKSMYEQVKEMIIKD